MPYCSECGKEVEKNWISCPYCSCDLGSSQQNKVTVNDSVVMGNVAINDVTRCANCESVGVTIYGCISCKEICFCNVCEKDIHATRSSTMSDMRNGPKRSPGIGEFGSGTNYEIRALGTGRYCSSCFEKRRSELCDSNCDNCGIYYNSSDLDFRRKGIGGTLRLDPMDAKRQGLCYWCGSLLWRIALAVSRTEDWLKRPIGLISLREEVNTNGKQEIQQSGEKFIDKGTTSREKSLKVNITRQDMLFREINDQFERYLNNRKMIEEYNENFKRKEAEKEARKKAQASDCFIATAAYGTKYEEKINVLRCWRDTKLMPSKVLSPFVRFYYKYSPPIAKFISNKPFFRRLVRVVLTPTIFLIGLVVRSEYPLWTDQGNPQ